MIQRKQTIFLFLAAVFGILSLCMQLAAVSYEGMTTWRIFSLWAIGQNNATTFIPCPLFILMILSATLSVCTIFLYKRRLCRLAYVWSTSLSWCYGISR